MSHFDDDEPEYEILPTETNGPRRLMVSAIAVLAIFGVLASSTLVWVTRQINPSGPQGASVSSVIIPPGSSFSDVAQILEDENVISSARVFGWYSRFVSVPNPQAGEYVEFHENSSMSEAADVLAAGPVPAESISVTVIPGQWLSDSLTSIAEEFPAVTPEQLQFALATDQVTSDYDLPVVEPWEGQPLDPAIARWEGRLLPETYTFDADATPQEILQRFVDGFDAALDELDYDNAVARTGRTASDLITIASMVERETGDPPEEAGKISRVIHNRLEEGTPLGIDATILYGLGRRGGTDDPLTESDLAIDTPYQSRLNAGLPPTPIGAPGLAALAAAIEPTEGDWTYYVLVRADPAEHLFTNSYDEFLAAKERSREQGIS